MNGYIMEHLADPTALERRLVVKANELRKPLTATFELTPLCNLSCDMCFIRMSKQELQNKDLLTLEQWLEIACQLKKQGTLFILLTGGEPLLYPNFIKLYTSLREMGFIVTINTNATLITEDIALLFSKLKPRRINVTLYGTSEETYEILCHNKWGFKKCIHGIELLRKYNIDVKLNVSAVQKNQDDFTDIITYAQVNNIPAVVNSYMFPFIRRQCLVKRDVSKERLDPQCAARLEVQYLKYKHGEEFSEYCEGLKEYFCQDEVNLNALGLECRAGKSSCWINWQGNISPCFAMENPSVSLKEQTVDDAWKYIISRCDELEQFTECSGCKLRPICNVCYAAALHEKKEKGNLNHLCEIAKWKKKYLLEE